MSKLIDKFKSTPKKDRIKFFILTAFIVFTIVIGLILLPQFLSWFDMNHLVDIKNSILSFGVWGWFILAGIMMFQIVFAIIPGEPIQIIAGLLYGPWAGLFACMVGSFAGTALIYYLVKWLGASFVNSMIDVKKTKRLSFLHDIKKLNLVVFILFIIPGTPKDVMSYIIPVTEIKPMHYFILTTLARSPSIMLSTFAGNALIHGNWLLMVVILAAVAVAALLGVIFYERILALIVKERQLHGKAAVNPETISDGNEDSDDGVSDRKPKRKK